jgi:exodeoxyribonuclease-3
MWDVAFANYVSSLNDAGPLIVCGDLNVAHKEMDIFHAQSNKNTAGFTPEECANFSSLLLNKAGLRDTFRELHPDKVSYSWWSYRMQARKRNVGWRIDYLLTSSTINAVACDIAVHIDGSDHAPVWMDIEKLAE